MSVAENKVRKTITLNKDLLNAAMEKGKLEFLNSESEVITAALKLYIKLGLDKVQGEA